MKKLKSKLIIAVTITMLLATTVVSIAAQTGTKRNLEVWSGTTTLSYNGTDQTSQLSPIIINGTTYLPLRSAATLFNKDISYDASTSKITVADKTDSTISNYQAEINNLNTQLATLQSEYTSLQTKYNNLVDDSDNDTSDLESALEDEYDDYSFDVSGDVEGTVTVKANVSSESWDSTDNQDDAADLIRDMLDFIADECDDADAIKIYLYDGKVSASDNKIAYYSYDTSDDIDDVEDDDISYYNALTD